MISKLTNLRYAMLTLVGILSLCVTFAHKSALPSVQACGHNATCTYSESQWGCDNEACSCGGNLISWTCYRSEGTCNDDGSPVYFSHCYQGGCCCPSGNCAGQGGGGRGGGDLVGFNNVGESCTSDWDCDVAYFCDQTTGTCQ
jgi:hypothetical protein